MLRQIISKINLGFLAIVLITGSVSASLAAGPIITDFTPKKGSAGDNIIIRGNGFIFANLSSNKIAFNGKRGDVSILSEKENQLVVTVPKGTISGRISVDNANGSHTSNNAFEVISTTDQIASSGSLIGKSDRLILETYMSGLTRAGSDDEYYASPESILLVTRIDSGIAYVRFKENWTDNKIGTGKTDRIYAHKCKGGLVKTGVEYAVKATELQNTAALNQGVDYGLLVLPYKYHFTDQSLTGEATLGGYAGYKFSWPGIAISFPVVSAGVGVVNTTQQSGVSTSGTAPSFTFAGGLIINLTKTGLFQIGIIAGADWAGKNSQYKYEGQPWVAVSFGTNFTK